MIKGIGIDIVELDRIQAGIDRSGNFAKRLLTEREHTHFLELSAHRQVEFLAGRFSAKEAFSKALGTGIGTQLSFQDIEILPDEKNKPVVRTEKFSGRVHVSISHSRAYAVSQIVLEE